MRTNAVVRASRQAPRVPDLVLIGAMRTAMEQMLVAARGSRQLIRESAIALEAAEKIRNDR
jgi:hypothetical protein